MGAQGLQTVPGQSGNWDAPEQPLGWFDLHGCYLEFGVFVLLVSWTVNNG